MGNHRLSLISFVHRFCGTRLQPSVCIQRFWIFLFVFCFSSWCPTQAQEINAAISGDLVDALRMRLQNLGSAGSVAALDSCTALGTFVGTSGDPTATFQWMNSGGEFRYETTTSAGVTTVFVSGHGHPSVTTGGDTRRLHQHIASFDLPGHLLARILQEKVADARFHVNSATPATASVAEHYIVSLQAKDSTETRLSQQTWYFDNSSMLAKVSYRAPTNENAEHYVDVSLQIQDFKRVSGVLVPHRITYFEGDRLIRTAVLDTVVCGQNIDPAQFSSPVGGQK